MNDYKVKIRCHCTFNEQHLIKKDVQLEYDAEKSMVIKANSEDEARSFVDNILECMNVLRIAIEVPKSSYVRYDTIGVEKV